MAIQYGSWGTPELGITEKISNLLGSGLTAQGGSNLSGNVGTLPTAQVKTDAGYQQLQGPDLGWWGPVGPQTQTQTNQTPSQNTAPKNYQQQPQPQQQSGGVNKGNLMSMFPGYSGWNIDSAWADYLATGGSGKGASAPSGFVSPEGQGYGSADEYYSLIDQAYNPQYSYLNQAQQNLEMGQKTALEEAQAAFNTQQQMAQSQKEAALGKLSETGVKGQQSYESALAQARDLYDQLQRGYGQRFGGSTSAGQAATEIANRERLKQQGLNFREFQNINQQVQSGKNEVENQFKQNMLQLEQNKQSAINQVNSDFRDKLAQITQSKGMLDSAKAQAKLTALQNLRAQVLQIQQQNMQFQQSLALQREQANIQLDSYAKQLAMSQGKTATGTRGSFNTLQSKPTTNLQATGTTQENIYSPVGQIKYRDPRELLNPVLWNAR